MMVGEALQLVQLHRSFAELADILLDRSQIGGQRALAGAGDMATHLGAIGRTAARPHRRSALVVVPEQIDVTVNQN